MKTKYLLTILLMISTSDLFAQGSYFEEGISIRNRQKGQYYKMMSWDNSQFKEFAYWEETEFRAIINFMNWRAAFPKGYNKSDTLTKYPAIVVLHGNGQSGRSWDGKFGYAPSDPRYDNNDNQLGAGGFIHLTAVNAPTGSQRSFPGVLIYPQVSHSGAWRGENLVELARIIEFMISGYHLDPDKIYLHGLSNGGKGTWDFATARPDLFAAILPMAGVGSDIDVSTDTLTTTPIWLFQGELDTNPSKGWAKQWVDSIKGKGGSMRYTVYEGVVHNVWNKAYAEPDFFSWMLDIDKKNIHVFQNPLVDCLSPDTPFKLGFSAGFLGYQWTNNDQDISGMKGRYLTTTEKGIYTVKFKRRTDSLWAESYPLVVGDGSSISLTATNSVVLPLPEGSDNSLNLVAPTGFPAYEWYKDGQLVKSTSDSILTLNDKVGQLFQPSDAGLYTVKIPVDAGCPFDESNPIKVSYKDNSQTEINLNVSASALSSSEMVITWSDTNNESYYEVWQQRVNTLTGEQKTPPGYPGHLYTFRGTKPANDATFTDSGLRPGAKYIYRVRAILSDGKVRLSEETEATTTDKDETPPSAPSELTAIENAQSEIHLEWKASIDDDVVYRYEIFDGESLVAEVKADTIDSDPTDGDPPPPLEYVMTGFSEKDFYLLKVRAVDYEGYNKEGNYSDFSNIVKLSPKPEQISVYPNPFNSTVTIKTENLDERQQRLILYDMGAKTMYDQNHLFEGGEATMDLRNLRMGIYVLQIGQRKFRIFKDSGSPKAD